MGIPSLAALAGRVSGQFLRLSGLGGGTALPGILVLALDPHFIERQSSKLSPRLVVSGTNGKTSTVRMLSATLSTAGLAVVTNQAGSNLLRGVAAALAASMPRAAAAAGVFEADEFALPEIMAAVKPHAVVLLNLFRDQLDRYGEVETIRNRWLQALQTAGCLVIANADDPLVADVALACGREVRFFGAGSPLASDRRGIVMDVVRCPRCMGRLERPFFSYGHLGDYRCGQCGFLRPARSIELVDVNLGSRWEEPTVVTVRESTVSGAQEHRLAVQLRGVHSAYNVMAACLAARAMDISWDSLELALKGLKPAFGRGDLTEVEGIRLLTVLVKNPAGFDQALRSYVGPGPDAYLIAINDLIADGRDVSWLWDVDLGPLAEVSAPVVCSGLRAEDMALRLKYAGVETSRISIAKPLRRAIREVARLAGPGGTVVAFPTYTALLELRRQLHRMGVAEPFWRG